MQRSPTERRPAPRANAASTHASAPTAVAVAALLGAALGALSTADPRWTGWIGSSAAPWLLAAWALARTGTGPARAACATGAGIAAMMLTYEGAQALLDPDASFGYTAPWVVVTAALALAAGAWRTWARAHPVPATSAGSGAIALPTLLLAIVQVAHRAPAGAAVGVAAAVLCASVAVAVDRRSIVADPRAAWAGALGGSALFALGGLLVVVP